MDRGLHISAREGGVFRRTPNAFVPTKELPLLNVQDTVWVTEQVWNQSRREKLLVTAWNGASIDAVG